MGLIVYDQDPVFLDYINKALDNNFVSDSTRTLAHVKANEDGSYTMLAVVAFNNWTQYSVEVSIAGSSGLWATKKFVRAVYEYAFYHAKKERIHMVVEPTNTEALEMHKRLGHFQEGLLADWFGPDKYAYIYGLTKRQYLAGKWAPKEKE